MLRLVAFDMDGTLVDIPSSWAAVHQFFGESNDESLRLFQEDRIDDEEFVRRDIRLWRKHRPDLTIDELEEILANVPLMPGAASLLGALHSKGVLTAIVSGGIDILAKRIGRFLGIDYVWANGFRVDADGHLTGEGIIRVPIKRKAEVLARIQSQLNVLPEATASVGNSEIDVGLFERSRISVAFLPSDETVRSSATVVVNERDLNRVLEPLFPTGLSA